MIEIRNVFGVDFSGAEDAGRKIWIASGLIEGERLNITDCRQAKDLPGGNLDRAAAIAALRTFIASQSRCCAFGLDFPFSLAQEMIRHSTWVIFAQRFARDYPQAEDLLHGGTTTRARHGAPLSRQTDIDAKTPFAPHNLRLYKQTYYGIRDLLATFFFEDSARVLPMQPYHAGKPILLEICPASTLKRHYLYRSYKGTTASHRANREYLLAEMERRGVVVAADMRPQLLDDTEGDALDSVIAAYATKQALPQIPNFPQNPRYWLEGFVYGC